MLHIFHRSFYAVQKNCCFSFPQDNVCKKTMYSSPFNPACRNPHH